jgi:hypothetical protein
MVEDYHTFTFLARHLAQPLLGFPLKDMMLVRCFNDDVTGDSSIDSDDSSFQP